MKKLVILFAVAMMAVSAQAQTVTESKTFDNFYVGINGLLNKITVGRYHSWVVSQEEFPSCLEITAVSDDGGSVPNIMALRHREYEVHGIQFHPESVLTPEGKIIIKNFLDL